MSAIVEFDKFIDGVKGSPFIDNHLTEKGTAALNAAIKQAENSVNFLEDVEQLISFVDLTTLFAVDTREKVQALAKKALHPYPKNPSLRCAAVCVYPLRVADVVEYLKGADQKILIASVAAGFPSGQYHMESRLLEIELAIKDGASEIDVVINRAAALEENWKLVYDELRRMREKTPKNVLLKVILAVGELKTLNNIYKASWIAMMAGADFIKTSTGKEEVNATLCFSYAMLVAIHDFEAFTQRRVGFKAAGGIKSTEDALQYRCLVEQVLGHVWMNPNMFRLGASSLLDNIVTKLLSFEQ